MGNSLKKFLPEHTSCSRDEAMNEAAVKAERIRTSQGYHEAEISCEGEAGLQQSLIRCKKNPGHHNFIPVHDFNIEHLPPLDRDNDIVDYIRATSDLTCRLSVPGISEDRPDTWPDDSDKPFPFSDYKGDKGVHVKGTGWVSDVCKYTEESNKSCVCESCCEPGRNTPTKTWGTIHISTVSHVVVNTEEARHTKCQFFYDSPETDINKVLTLTGLKVVASDIKGDRSKMEFVTHDMELLNKFYNMYWCWRDLRNKVYLKLRSNINPGISVSGAGCDTNSRCRNDLCIVVSHPHGCAKQISVGTWKFRHVVQANNAGDENSKYYYNTPTCPGSSGGMVISFWATNMLTDWFFHEHPPHSEGHQDNNNNSALAYEVVDDGAGELLHWTCLTGMGR